MKSRASTLALSAVAWIGFNAVMLWTAAFLADMAGPRTVDARMRTDPVIALLTDVGLLLMFGVQHSVMARAGVKSTMRRVIPVALERTVYLLATEICLVLLMLLWQPIDGQVWQVSGPAALVLWGLCAAGWALAAWSTYAVDHLELTGLRQAGWTPARAPEGVGALQTRGLYAVVRHPLMTGLLLAFWATLTWVAGILSSPPDPRHTSSSGCASRNVTCGASSAGTTRRMRSVSALSCHCPRATGLALELVADQPTELLDRSVGCVPVAVDE